MRLKTVSKYWLLTLLLAAPLAADIKLRIYLKDGSLQAGNLIKENPDSFVIMTKEDRVEIPKDKIMFVNGKTLKQWQAQPDKLFQTEIMPSNVPDPKFVNDKAPLPAAPKIEPIKQPVQEVMNQAVPE